MMANTMASATLCPPPMNSGIEEVHTMRIEDVPQSQQTRAHQAEERIIPRTHKPSTGLRPQRSAAEPKGSATRNPKIALVSSSAHAKKGMGGCLATWDVGRHQLARGDDVQLALDGLQTAEVLGDHGRR